MHLQALLVKFNLNGDTVFVKRFGGYNDDLGYKAVETPDGGFALCGQANRTAGNNGKFYLVKTDSLGNLEWEKTYHQPGFARALSIVNAHDGGYMLCGDGYTSTAFGYDTYLMKTDSLGNELWKKSFGTPRDDCGGNITSSSDSTYIITTCMDSLGIVQPGGYPIVMTTILKVDTSGNILWSYYYYNNKVAVVAVTREVAPGEGYIYAGSIVDNISGREDEVALILRFDNDGNLLWEKRYGYYSRTNNRFSYTRPEDVEPTNDGGFIVMGGASEKNYSEFWLLKIDSNGCMGDYCGLTDPNCYYQPYPDCITSIQEHGNADSYLRVFPNPTTGVLHIQTENTQERIQSITMYDIVGKNVPLVCGQCGASEGGACRHGASAGDEFNISHLPTCLYYCKIILSNGVSITKKVVKE